MCSTTENRRPTSHGYGTTVRTTPSVSWRAYANQDADWIKTNPKMHVTNSIADPHPSSGSFARDVLCEHGNLQPEPKKRILISAEVRTLPPPPSVR